jgi:hypothetical protein
VVEVKTAVYERQSLVTAVTVSETKADDPNTEAGKEKVHTAVTDALADVVE